MNYTVRWPHEQAFREAGEWDDMPPAARRIAENCCHVHLDNGYMVSILQVEALVHRGRAPWYETWIETPAGRWHTDHPETHPSFERAWEYVEWAAQLHR